MYIEIFAMQSLPGFFAEVVENDTMIHRTRAYYTAGEAAKAAGEWIVEHENTPPTIVVVDRDAS